MFEHECTTCATYAYDMQTYVVVDYGTQLLVIIARYLQRVYIGTVYETRQP